MRIAAGIVCGLIASWTAPARAVEFKDAVEALKNDDYHQVVDILNQYIPAHPKDARAYALRGRALVETGASQKAVEDLDKAIELKAGDNSNIFANRGRAYLELRQPEKALADLDKAIEMSPKTGLRYYHRSKAQQMLGRRDKALADLEKAVELEPKEASALTALSSMRFEDACEIVTFSYMEGGKQYVAQRPERVKDQEKAEAAYAGLGRALELNPNDLNALRVRVWASRMLGKPAEMVIAMKALCGVEPAEPTHWNQLAWELSTSPDKSVRDGKAAVKAAEKLDALTQHENALYLATLAAAYAEDGQFDKAVEVERQAIDRMENPEGKAEYTRRLELFERKKPLRLDRNPRPAAKPAEKPAKPN